MDKITRRWYNTENEREKQLYYYLSKFDMEEKELEIDKEDDAFVKKLKSKIKKLNEDKEFVSFLSREDDIKFQMNTVKYEGELVGKRKGINEGKNAEKMEIAKKLLQQKISLDVIMEATGLSQKEIENLQ